MKAAQFTLTSTVLAAALALGLAVALGATPAAAHHRVGHAGGPSDDGGGGIVYEATLTMGAFEFRCYSTTPCSPPDEVIVTPNTRENELRSNTDLDMVRPDPEIHPEEFDTWNDVFNACEEILGKDSVFNFFVANDEWRIAKAGGVRVIFRDIVPQGEMQDIDLEGAEVRVQLIGNQFDFDDEGIDNRHPFLPALGNTSIFELTTFSVTGTPLRGRGAIKSCRGSDGGGVLGVPSTLVIRAVAVAP